MLKLLIVEDDLTIRKGLVDCIDWCNYEIEVSGEAANGKRALEFIRTHPVDILITDVVMPQMDGIELVRRVRLMEREVKVAFISGHSDLQLLKEAFRLDAIDYIIKPIKREELETVLRKISGLCMQEKRQRDHLEGLKRKLDESMPLLKERFISTLLRKKITDNLYIENRIKFLGLPFNKNMKFTVMAFDIGAASESLSCGSQETREMGLLSALDGIPSESAGDFNSRFLIEDDLLLILVVSSKTGLGYKGALELAKKIQQNIFTHTGFFPSVGIGKEVGSPCELHYSYVESKRALEQKYFLGQDAVIHIHDIERINIKAIPDMSDTKTRIIEAVRLGRRMDVENAVDELFNVIRDSGAVSMMYVRNVCIELAVFAEKEYLELKIPDSRLKNGTFLWEALSQCKSLEDTRLWVKKEFSEMADTIRTFRANSTGKLISMMVKYICESYSSEITIHTLAKEFYITSNYVCILFKKETGKTFNEYLTEVRMEKAIELLGNPVLKVYEIAERTGYHDVDYFGKLFKKYTGLTISQFRHR